MVIEIGKDRRVIVDAGVDAAALARVLAVLERPMIPVSAGVRIWIATGHTDMRKGMNGLALLVQEGLGRDPFAGDVFVFRGRAGSLIKAFGMTGSDCRSTPSGWTVDGLSGRRRWMAWWR